jgi:hypothetical protein
MGMQTLNYDIIDTVKTIFKDRAEISVDNHLRYKVDIPIAKNVIMVKWWTNDGMTRRARDPLGKGTGRAKGRIRRERKRVLRVHDCSRAPSP